MAGLVSPTTAPYANINKSVTGLLAIVVPVGSNLTGCLTYQFAHYVSRVKTGHHMATLLATVTLLLNLTGMMLEINTFKSFTYHALVDQGVIKLANGPLWAMTMVNFTMTSLGRIFFARLASTMLRAPKPFLCLSGALLLFSIIGLAIETIYMGLNASGRSPSSGFFSVTHTELLVLHLLWTGAVTAWDVLIAGVLLYNVSDRRRRFRFGTIDGKCSFALVLFFESFFMVTFITCLIVTSSIVLTFKLHIDSGTLSVIYSVLGSFAAKFNGISILCSLQHKFNDLVRFEPKDVSLGTRNLKAGGLHMTDGRAAHDSRKRHLVRLPPLDHHPLSFDSIDMADDGEEETGGELRSRGGSNSWRKGSEDRLDSRCVSELEMDMVPIGEGSDSGLDSCCTEKIALEKEVDLDHHDVMLDRIDLSTHPHEIRFPPPTLQVRR